MMVIENKYEIGQTVYLITDEDQLPRLVFCINIYKNELIYKLVCGTVISEHYDFEISEEKQLQLT